MKSEVTATTKVETSERCPREQTDREDLQVPRLASTAKDTPVVRYRAGIASQMQRIAIDLRHCLAGSGPEASSGLLCSIVLAFRHFCVCDELFM